MNQHIKLLGLKAKDRVTGFTGVISTISFDLYGCIQAVLSPPVGKKGESSSGRWFDISRLEIKDEKPVMPAPDFAMGYVADGYKGAAEKPSLT